MALTPIALPDGPLVDKTIDDPGSPVDAAPINAIVDQVNDNVIAAFDAEAIVAVGAALSGGTHTGLSFAVSGGHINGTVLLEWFQDRVAEMFDGTQVGATVGYDDGTGKITVTVDATVDEAFVVDTIEAALAGANGITFTRVGDTITAGLPDLGTGYKGTFSDLAARLADMDNRIGTGGGTPPSGSPSPKSSDTPKPAGYSTAVYTEEFDNPNALVANGGRWSSEPTGVQNGGKTNSVFSMHIPANITIDTTLKAMRLAATAVTTVNGGTTALYSGAYATTRGASTANRLLPLFGFYETCLRYTYAFDIWECFWACGPGGSGNVEVDCMEVFNAQYAGRPSNDLHFTSTYGNDVLSAGRGIGTVETLLTQNSSHSFVGPNTASTGYGKAVDLDDNTPFLTTAGPTYPSGDAAEQQGDWHVVAFQVEKVPFTDSRLLGGTGYSVKFSWYVDGIKTHTWFDSIAVTEALTASAGSPNPNYVPRWVTAGLGVANADVDHFWDLRYDIWVGGQNIGDPVDSSGSRIFTYDGKIMTSYGPPIAGTTSGAAPTSVEPDTHKWAVDPSDPYYLDVAWLRVTVPDTVVVPPPPTHDWDVDITATTGTVAVGTGDALTARFPTADSGTATLAYDGTVISPITSMPSIKSTLIAGSDADVRWDPVGANPIASLYTGFFFRGDNLPAANQYIATVNPATGSSNGQIRWISASKKLEFQDAFTTVLTSTTVLAADTWYWIEWNLQPTVGQKFRIYDATGVLLEASGIGSYAATAANLQQVHYGLSGTSITNDAYYTDMAINYSDWVGFPS